MVERHREHEHPTEAVEGLDVRLALSGHGRPFTDVIHIGIGGSALGGPGTHVGDPAQRANELNHVVAQPR